MKTYSLLVVSFFSFCFNTSLQAQHNNISSSNLLASATAKTAVDDAAALDELNREYYSVDVFPNNVKHEITVQYSLSNKSSVSIELYDTAGKKIKNWQSQNLKPKGNYKQAISTSDIKNGTYFIKLSIDKDETITKLVINA